MNGLRV